MSAVTMREALAAVNPALLEVATITETPKGWRFKTLDAHAATAIERIARRQKGHTVRARYEIATGYYIVNATREQ